MRKTAETFDHLSMPQRVVVGAVEGFVLHFAAQAGEERDRAFLVEQGLAVFEGQVGEPALPGREVLVAAGSDQLFRDAQRLRVTGKGARRAAENVAGELVEQQDARQQRFVRVLAGGSA